MPMPCRRHYSCFHAADMLPAFADCLSSTPAVSCCAAIDLSAFFQRHGFSMMSFLFAAMRVSPFTPMIFIAISPSYSSMPPFQPFHFRRLLRLFSLLFMPIISLIVSFHFTMFSHFRFFAARFTPHD
jgi:hypothetical protein